MQFASELVLETDVGLIMYNSWCNKWPKSIFCEFFLSLVLFPQSGAVLRFDNMIFFVSVCDQTFNTAVKKVSCLPVQGLWLL